MQRLSLLPVLAAQKFCRPSVTDLTRGLAGLAVFGTGDRQRRTTAVFRMKKVAGKFVSALLLSPLLCSAATSVKDEQVVISKLNGLRSSYGPCLAKASSATAPMRACMEAELDYQDKRLKKAYQALMAKLSPTLQTKLKAEEGVWIQYRDNRCASVVDGIERPELEPLGCKVDETGKQASDLEARLFVR